MKSLSVIVTFLLLILAAQLASRLKRAGALPADSSHAQRAPAPMVPGTAGYEASGARRLAEF